MVGHVDVKDAWEREIAGAAHLMREVWENIMSEVRLKIPRFSRFVCSS